jgi:hypothetical protein
MMIFLSFDFIHISCFVFSSTLFEIHIDFLLLYNTIEFYRREIWL